VKVNILKLVNALNGSSNELIKMREIFIGRKKNTFCVTYESSSDNIDFVNACIIAPLSI